ncbi:MAG: acyl-CoA dehydrogenase family protein [Acidimicrobiales bacterium]
MTDYRAALGHIVDEIVTPQAQEVDRCGSFPRAAIEALGAAGLLGLVSAHEVGGVGRGLPAAAEVVEGLARACGSTAMILMMHYVATSVVEAYGPEEVRQGIASGSHLTTLAFSEPGSRSHFWVSEAGARPEGDKVRLDGQKSWVTSAGEASSYLWSTRPLEAEGAMTLWLVPADTPGLSHEGSFDGLGLRGNASTPVRADGALVERRAMLGPDGAGLDVAITVLLPWFLVLSAAVSLGLMEAVVERTLAHLCQTRLTHLDQALIDQPLPRADLARMRLATDTTRALVGDTLRALEEGREDAVLRTLEVKAAAAEAAIEVTDLAMKVCGGSAFRKDLGIERRFRDARAARVMAPTTEALLDFLGRVVAGLPLFER